MKKFFRTRTDPDNKRRLQSAFRAALASHIACTHTGLTSADYAVAFGVLLPKGKRAKVGVYVESDSRP